MPTLSPKQAADRAGVTRRAIMAAIERGKLKAQRNNLNYWRVDADSLTLWIEGRQDRAAPSVETVPGSIAVPTGESISPEAVEVARLEERLRAAEDQLQAERDRGERDRADHAKALERHERERAELVELLREAQRPRGLLERLLGRRR